MRRPPRLRRRILLNVAIALSALFCLAAVAMWVRSTALIDFAERSSARTGLRLWSTSGVVAVHVFDRAQDVPPQPWLLASEPHGGGYFLEVTWAHLGFAWETPAPPPAPRNWMAKAPYWSLAAATALLPAARATCRLRRRRCLRPGLCPACGYDLRATPDRCPECGAIATSGGTMLVD